MAKNPSEFIQDIAKSVAKFAAPKDNSTPKPDDLMTDLSSILDDISKSGAMPDRLVAEHQEKLQELSVLTAQSTDALKNKDFSLLETINAKLMQFNGFDPKDFTNVPEIFDAIEDGDLNAVKQALKNWDINAPHGQFEKTALYAACADIGGVSLEIAHYLLDAGADPSLGLTNTGVLHGLGFGLCDGIAPDDLAGFAAKCVEKGADIEECSDNLQWTPLMTAINEWNHVAVEALLIAGANPNAKAGADNHACTAGQTCLGMSSKKEITEILKTYGARP